MHRLLIPLVLCAAPDDFLTKLKTTAEQARENIYSAAKSGYGWVPAAARDVPAGARVEVARAAAVFARGYLKSADFKERYAKDWAAEEPQAPETLEARALREADEEKQRLEQEKTSRAELKKNAASEKNPELKKMYEQMLVAQEQARKQFEAPEFKAQMAQFKQAAAEAAKQQYATDKAQYDTDHARWLARKDPKAMLVARVDEFLALAASVDFKAKTVTRDGRRVFADDANESKSSNWKLLYRLGPEVTAVLRTQATEFKKEL